MDYYFQMKGYLHFIFIESNIMKNHRAVAMDGTTRPHSSTEGSILTWAGYLPTT